MARRTQLNAAQDDIRAPAVVLAAPFPAADPPAPPTIAARVRSGSLRCLYSTAVEGDISRMLGRPHYSYRFAEAKFLDAFAAAKRGLMLLRMPEYYASAGALPLPAGSQDDTLVHLIFRSTEEIRLLKVGHNICCFAWEFEVLKDSTAPGEHPFLNQKRMLAACDEIWVPCRFTRDVLAAHGLSNVHVIPAPIPIPATPRLERTEALAVVGQIGVMPLIHNFLLSHQDNARVVAARSQSLIDWLAPRLGAAMASGVMPLVYLSILNPEDFRKNLDSLLRGFYYFQQRHPAAFLIVKVLTSPERFTLDRVISDVIPNKLASGSVFETENIVFVNRFLPEDEMQALYSLADFYLSPSIAEGQNLPLLEAMAHGTIPVSTDNTAMADYIDADCAFVIEGHRAPAPTEHLAGSIAGRPYQVDVSGPRAVYDALVASSRASPDMLRAKSRAAVAAVRQKFSPEAVWPRIEARFAAILAADLADQPAGVLAS